MKEFIVSTANIPGSYRSLGEVISHLPSDESEECIIKIHPGIYREKVEIKHGNLTIEGLSENPSDTVLTFDDFAFDKMPDGGNRGTFRSYSLLLDASCITMKNLTVSNTSGDESKVGQALALYADGNKLKFENCRFEGRQDTIFTGPLPPKEIQPGGFIGPKQFAPRINGLHYYKDCYICGNVDFIFGSATAFFENCQIESLSHGDGSKEQGYATAPSTPQGQAYGYVFENCRFTSEECAPNTCYLGRPWRDYGQTVLINCLIGNHIKQEGFHDWGKELARKEALFAVYNCKSNDGSSYIPTASFAKTLTEAEASFFSKKLVLSGWD